MKKTFTLLLITFLVYIIKAQEPNFEWGKQVGGSGYTDGNTILTDSNEDIYIIGNFSGIPDFNPLT